MRLKPRSIFTLLLIVILGFGLLTAASWPLRASILVLTIGSLCWLLAVVQLFLELKPHHEAVSSGMDIELAEDQELARNPLQALDIWLWMIGCIIAIKLFGLYVTIPIWTFFYSFLHGARWWLALILALVCVGFLWGFFDYILHVPIVDAVFPIEEWIRG